MKKERIIEILILLGVTGFIIGTLYTVFYFKEIKPNIYNIEFNDVDSIIKGSPVRFMGIIVGHVRNLERENDKILCQIVITKPHTKIPDGSVAQIEFNGLGGSKSVEIMPPSTNNPSFKGIIAHDALRLNDMLDSFKYVGEVFTIVKEFLDGVTPESSMKTMKALSQTPDLDPLNKSLETMVDKEQETKEKIRKIKEVEQKADSITNKFIYSSNKFKNALRKMQKNQH